MDQGMILEQKQSLHLTPQMRQSIKILQMSTLELMSWLEKEAQDNPVLEIELNQIEEKNKEIIQAIEEQVDDQKRNLNHRRKREEWGEKPISPDVNHRKDIIFEPTREMGQRKDNLFDVSPSTTLHEHLLLCLNMITKNDIDYKIGEYLIGNINKNGYLEISCWEVSRDLSIPEKRVRQVLAMIQNCSVPGLGARSVKECLLLQLKYLNLEKKEIIRKLILFYLTELSQKKFSKICKELHLSNYDIQQLLDVMIKNFDPKPGRIFYQEKELRFLFPDMIIKKINNQYEIIENIEHFPSLKINSLYKSMLEEDKLTRDAPHRKLLHIKKGKEHQETLKYLEKNLNSARWIIRCIEQRRKTVLDITRFVIDYQRDFLEHGIAYLKPLSMKKVADSVDLHESTVSRAIKGKKIQLPRGFYDMKFFFSKALPQKWNMSISNEKIKSLIKKYIFLENPYCPYSDQKLADLLLKNKKIKIARRTITKYRKLQGISSAKIRRRYQKREMI